MSCYSLVRTEQHGKRSLREAKTVFADPLFIDFYDPDHSSEENRYIIVGAADSGRLSDGIVYGERRAVRLISARELTASERKAYEQD
jgi:uncharacterized DUF497 family protein